MLVQSHKYCGPSAVREYDEHWHWHWRAKRERKKKCGTRWNWMSGNLRYRGIFHLLVYRFRWRKPSRSAIETSIRENLGTYIHRHHSWCIAIPSGHSHSQGLEKNQRSGSHMCTKWPIFGDSLSCLTSLRFSGWVHKIAFFRSLRPAPCLSLSGINSDTCFFSLSLFLVLSLFLKRGDIFDWRVRSRAV